MWLRKAETYNTLETELEQRCERLNNALKGRELSETEFKALHKRGLTLEDEENYSLEGYRRPEGIKYPVNPAFLLDESQIRIAMSDVETLLEEIRRLVESE